MIFKNQNMDTSLHIQHAELFAISYYHALLPYLAAKHKATVIHRISIPYNLWSRRQ